MGFSWGQRSSDVLSTLHPDLAKVMNLAIKHSTIDFGLVEGYRSVERQNILFKAGKSRIDGIRKKGKHNYNPSLAVDIIISAKEIPSLGYDWNHLSYVAGVVQTCASILYEAGEITHKVRWGGNWDMDGIILIDQEFDDGPHFELV